MPTPDEITLLDRIKSGDQEALKALYAEHFSALARIAADVSGETTQAKDVVQNVFIQFWQRRDSIQITTGVFPYLRKMVIHEVLASRRKANRRTALWQQHGTSQTTTSGPEELMREKETDQAIQKAIDALPERCSEIFRMSRYAAMSYAEIAEALDISIKTVENQMGKALRNLRDALREYMP